MRTDSASTPPVPDSPPSSSAPSSRAAGAGERDAAREALVLRRLAVALEDRERPLGADQRAGALGHDRQHLGHRPGAVDLDGGVGEVAQQPGVARGGARGGLAQLGEIEVGPHAGDQLARGERLEQVVVGPGGEALDRGLLPGARGEQDHRQLRRAGVRAQLGQQPEAVELGHHRVGEDQVGPALAHRRQGGAAVAHRLDVPVAGEQPLEVVAQVGVVVGDQDPRAGRRGRRRRPAGPRPRPPARRPTPPRRAASAAPPRGRRRRRSSGWPRRPARRPRAARGP